MINKLLNELKKCIKKPKRLSFRKVMKLERNDIIIHSKPFTRKYNSIIDKYELIPKDKDNEEDVNYLNKVNYIISRSATLFIHNEYVNGLLESIRHYRSIYMLKYNKRKTEKDSDIYLFILNKLNLLINICLTSFVKNENQISINKDTFIIIKDKIKTISLNYIEG